MLTTPARAIELVSRSFAIVRLMVAINVRHYFALSHLLAVKVMLSHHYNQHNICTVDSITWWLTWVLWLLQEP